MAEADHVDAPFQEEDVPMDGLLNLLHLRYAYTSEYSTEAEKKEARQGIIDAVRKNNMVGYADVVAEVVGMKLTQEETKAMVAANEKKVADINAKLKDAEENLGDIEVRDQLLARCEHYASIGELDLCLKESAACMAKTLASGPKLDLCFQRVRLGFAYSNHDIVNSALKDLSKMLKDGDWERRNRAKMYEGLYCVYIRQFDKGAKLLLDGLSTFAATELLSYQQYVFLTGVAGLATLDRAGLKKYLVDCPEVLAANDKELNGLISALYECKYAEFFDALAAVCHKMRRSVFLNAHTNFFFRELRIKVFNQFLDSYSSVTLQSMAASFALPVSVLDHMLFTLVSNERLACKIDRVSGNVLTFRGDHINFQYHKIVKEGDILLNKIQKLSRVVEQ